MRLNAGLGEETAVASLAILDCSFEKNDGTVAECRPLDLEFFDDQLMIMVYGTGTQGGRLFPESMDPSSRMYQDSPTSPPSSTMT